MDLLPSIVGPNPQPRCDMKSDPGTHGLLVSQTHELLVGEGYKLVEDAWEEFCRKTYQHDEDCNRPYLQSLSKLLRSAGWQTDFRKLRTFRYPGLQHEIELEPGGSEVTGHFLHYMNVEVLKD